MSRLQADRNALWVKEQSKVAGFDLCSLARVQQLTPEARLLEKWLNQNLHGDMAYMANHFDLRINPRGLLPEAKTVVVLAKDYLTGQTQTPLSRYRISKYSYGRDYHKVLRKQAQAFVRALTAQLGTDTLAHRICVDSAPIMEKAWAARSGLGWLGKNGNVLTQAHGSFYFLTIVLLDLECTPDVPVANRCGSCTACIDACPTQAIIAPQVVDANKCISYLTIETKPEFEIPESLASQMSNWIYGCDICQDVCPWNRFAPQDRGQIFEPNQALLSLNTEQWHKLSQDTFDTIAFHSPMKRAKYEGLLRNIRAQKRQA